MRGGFVYTANGNDEIYPDGSILIVGGQIAAVGHTRDVDRTVAADPSLHGSLHTLNATGMMVVPGFVNPHWHEFFALQLRLPRGVQQPAHDRGETPTMFAHGGDIATMSLVFDGFYGLADQLEPEEAEAIASYSLWTQLRSGTTTFGDLGSVNRPEAIIAATQALGLRGAVTLLASDGVCAPGSTSYSRTRDVDDVLSRVDAVLKLCEADRTGRIRAMPSVMYPANMSDELGAGIAELVEHHDTALATHIGAIRNEADMSRRYFGETSIRRFARLGLLTERLLAVHCAFADEQDRELLIDAGIHINHSPAKYGLHGESTLSETKLIIQLMRAGLDVSVSSDATSYPIGGMPEAMRQAWLAHNEIWADNTVVRPTIALAMASRIAAKGLRWADEIGSIEVGKQGDVVLVPINDWRYFLRPRPLEAFLLLGGSPDIDTVIIGGRVLLRDGHATFLDETMIRQRYLDALVSFEQRSSVIDQETLSRIVATYR